jgi:lysophospholipase L1-like esterase
MTDNYNEGHPGATVSEIAVFANLSLDEMPNIVLLMAGTNDMYTDANATAAPGQLGGLIDQIAEQCPHSTVLVAEIPPIGALFNGSEARVEVYNAAIPGIVASRVSEGKHVIAVNMSSYVALSDMHDALHPNNRGYSLMAQAWYAGLQQAASNGWIEKGLDTKASGNTTNSTSKTNEADSFKRNSFWATFGTTSVGLSAIALI